jgi:hypothetical protein
MRVGVFLGGTAMRGPSGVSDAIAAIHGIDLQDVFEIPQFAGGAPYAEGFVVAINGYSSRIVTPVLEPLQAIENNRDRALVADIADDATHKLIVRTDATASRDATRRSGETSVLPVPVSMFSVRDFALDSLYPRRELDPAFFGVLGEFGKSRHRPRARLDKARLELHARINRVKPGAQALLHVLNIRVETADLGRNQCGGPFFDARNQRGVALFDTRNPFFDTRNPFFDTRNPLSDTRDPLSDTRDQRNVAFFHLSQISLQFFIHRETPAPLCV